MDVSVHIETLAARQDYQAMYSFYKGLYDYDSPFSTFVFSLILTIFLESNW